MTAVFADTFYFFALTNAKDRAHQKAFQFSQERRINLVTTPWVLTELADGLSQSFSRSVFHRVLRNFRYNPRNVLVPATEALFERGVEAYNFYQDKDWSLTDCISFLVMRDYGITEALTADHHFAQAGFSLLLE